MIFAIMLALQVTTARVETDGCSAQQLASMRDGPAMMGRGDQLAYQEALERVSHDRSEPCALIRLQRSALLGWVEARAVAPKGGAPELLAPVRSALNELEQLKEERPVLALDVEYAQTAIRAAVSAAQDERPEMELLLTHARDLAERLNARQRRALWPRTYNLLAGELWFEVDRYEEARAAYDRAVRGEASPIAIVGLARAQARLGRIDEACVTYKRAGDASAALRKAAAADLSRCR